MEKQTLEEIYEVAGSDRGLIDNLRRIIKDEGIVPWFYKPNEVFENQRPIDMLKTKEIRRLEEMYYDIASGNFC
jgi:hypothetical protein